MKHRASLDFAEARRLPPRVSPVARNVFTIFVERYIRSYPVAGASELPQNLMKLDASLYFKKRDKINNFQRGIYLVASLPRLENSTSHQAKQTKFKENFTHHF